MFRQIGNDYNDHILLTDLEHIKKATVHYFQNVAGSTHTSKINTAKQA